MRMEEYTDKSQFFSLGIPNDQLKEITLQNIDILLAFLAQSSYLAPFVYVTNKVKLMTISIFITGKMRLNEYNVYLYISGY